MILVIGHEATYTGAPKILLNFVKWLIREKKEEVMFIIGRGGPILYEYKRIAPVFVWKKEYQKKKIFKRIRDHFINTEEKERGSFLNQLKKKDIRLILSNTIVNGEVLKALSFLDVPVITWVHELEYVIRLYNQKGMVDRAIEQTSYFIAASDAVKRNLINNHNIEPEKISIIYEPVEKMPDALNSKERKILKEELHIPVSAFVVGGCGSIMWRKGSDLFVQVAAILIKQIQEQDIYFIWIGGDKSSSAYLEIEREAEIQGVGDHLIFTGETDNPSRFYSIMDIFIMTSREDPFPIVNLEAAQYGLPIVCFLNSGGSPEFVTNDVGFVIAYSDVIEMSKRIIELKNNSDIRKKMSLNLIQKAKKHYFEHVALEVYSVIKKNML